MKKFLCSLIACSLILSLPITGFALTNNHNTENICDDSFDIDDYEHYTINFENTIQTKSAEANTAALAIRFVESLNLSDNGFSYIEDACLNELSEYENAGICLDSYTVLVPKASSLKYFGTYAGSKFYYDTTSIASFRRDFDDNKNVGVRKSSANTTKWTNWLLGAGNFVVKYVDKRWSIPYIAFKTLTGINSGARVHDGSYFNYVEQFDSVKTRSVYKKVGSNYRLGYQDQSCTYRLNAWFAPVGVQYDDYIFIATLHQGTLKSYDTSNTNIMMITNSQANHNSKVSYMFSKTKLKEVWS